MFQRFLSELQNELSRLPLEDREKIAAYYTELYFDKKDSGQKEEDIVLSFGNVKLVAERILKEYQQKRDYPPYTADEFKGNYNQYHHDSKAKTNSPPYFDNAKTDRQFFNQPSSGTQNYNYSGSINYGNPQMPNSNSSSNYGNPQMPNSNSTDNTQYTPYTPYQQQKVMESAKKQADKTLLTRLFFFIVSATLAFAWLTSIVTNIALMASSLCMFIIGSTDISQYYGFGAACIFLGLAFIGFAFQKLFWKWTKVNWIKFFKKA